jgi:hypothetical protein
MLVTNLHTIPIAVLLVGIRAIAISSPSSTRRATIYSPAMHSPIYTRHPSSHCHPLATIESPPLTCRCRLSTTHSPLSTYRHPVAAIRPPPFTRGLRLSNIRSPQSTCCHPLAAIGSLPFTCHLQLSICSP